jgi:hypothetical protein
MGLNPEDYGTILEDPAEVLDAGYLCVVDNNIIKTDNQTSVTCFSYYSSGESKKKTFKVIGSSTINFARIVNPCKNLNEDCIVFFGIILTWIGFGTLFEIENGLERSVSPNLVAGKSL